MRILIFFTKLFSIVLKGESYVNVFMYYNEDE